MDTSFKNISQSKISKTNVQTKFISGGYLNLKMTNQHSFYQTDLDFQE